ncbi:MAG: D-glycero-beta-D-manno-heptose 1-phosphate adenylyltransferase [Salinivirgaceae bacterium]|nr:D-glycero-beta-D-manno-heptose 1-phosphate adenylyltransferase [Salinivirgaceae bacterium]
MSHFSTLTSKLLTGQRLADTIAKWHSDNETIVFTNGCFDIIHRGHAEYLAKAADLGTKLIVGLNTDDSVRRLKGPTRPVNNEQARAIVLSAFGFIDAVALFSDDTPRNLIMQVQPDILVKGGDYRVEDIVGFDIVTARGGRVLTLPFVDGYSTTSTIKKSCL